MERDLKIGLKNLSKDIESEISDWKRCSNTTKRRFTVFAKTLNAKTSTLDISPNQTVSVAHLKKRMIEEEERIPPEQHRLLFDGKQLEDKQTVSMYNIQEKNNRSDFNVQNKPTSVCVVSRTIKQTILLKNKLVNFKNIFIQV